MARVNVESQWWSDPRRTKLMLKIGFAADAAAVNMWRTAQEYWGRNFGLVPRHIFDSLEFASELLGCGLAELRGDDVYVRGSNQHLSWLHEKRELAREAGKKGGQKSAKRPRDKKGRLLSSKQNPSDHPSEVQANPSSSKPSGSYSYSGSKEEEDATSPPVDENLKNPGTNSVLRFETRFHPEAEKFAEGIEKLGIAGSIRNNLPEIITRFANYSEFKDWANGLLDAADRKDRKNEFTSPAERKRWITAAVKKEIGAVS